MKCEEPRESGCYEAPRSYSWEFAGGTVVESSSILEPVGQVG